MQCFSNVFCFLCFKFCSFLSSRLFSMIAEATGAFLSSFVPMSSMASLYWVGCFFLMRLARQVVHVPFLLLSPGDHFMRCLQAVPSAAFTSHRTVLSLMVGANLLIYSQTQVVNFLRPAIGDWIVTEKLLLFSLTVMSAGFGGCKSASGGSFSSTGFKPGAEEAVDPSTSTLLLLAASDDTSTSSARVSL